MDPAGVEQDPLAERGLARVDVSGDTDVPQRFQVHENSTTPKKEMTNNPAHTIASGEPNNTVASGEPNNTVASGELNNTVASGEPKNTLAWDAPPKRVIQPAGGTHIAASGPSKEGGNRLAALQIRRENQRPARRSVPFLNSLPTRACQKEAGMLIQPRLQ